MSEQDITPEMANLWLQQLASHKRIKQLKDELTAEQLNFTARGKQLRKLVDSTMCLPHGTSL